MCVCRDTYLHTMTYKCQEWTVTHVKLFYQIGPETVRPLRKQAAASLLEIVLCLLASVPSLLSGHGDLLGTPELCFTLCLIHRNHTLGPDRACKVRAQVGIRLLRALPGGQAQGLDRGLSPKTRPVRAWAFGLCSRSPSPHDVLRPGPNSALLYS
jgi:hypothetical protein